MDENNSIKLGKEYSHVIAYLGNVLKQNKQSQPKRLVDFVTGLKSSLEEHLEQSHNNTDSDIVAGMTFQTFYSYLKFTSLCIILDNNSDINVEIEKCKKMLDILINLRLFIITKSVEYLLNIIKIAETQPIILNISEKAKTPYKVGEESSYVLEFLNKQNAKHTKLIDYFTSKNDHIAGYIKYKKHIASLISVILLSSYLCYLKASLLQKTSTDEVVLYYEIIIMYRDFILKTLYECDKELNQQKLQDLKKRMAIYPSNLYTTEFNDLQNLLNHDTWDCKKFNIEFNYLLAKCKTIEDEEEAENGNVRVFLANTAFIDKCREINLNHDSFDDISKALEFMNSTLFKKKLEQIKTQMVMFLCYGISGSYEILKAQIETYYNSKVNVIEIHQLSLVNTVTIDEKIIYFDPFKEQFMDAVEIWSENDVEKIQKKNIFYKLEVKGFIFVIVELAIQENPEKLYDDFKTLYRPKIRNVNYINAGKLLSTHFETTKTDDNKKPGKTIDELLPKIKDSYYINETLAHLKFYLTDEPPLKQTIHKSNVSKVVTIPGYLMDKVFVQPQKGVEFSVSTNTKNCNMIPLIESFKPEKFAIFGSFMKDKCDINKQIYDYLSTLKKKRKVQKIVES